MASKGILLFILALLCASAFASKIQESEESSIVERSSSDDSDDSKNDIAVPKRNGWAVLQMAVLFVFSVVAVIMALVLCRVDTQKTPLLDAHQLSLGVNRISEQPPSKANELHFQP